MKKRSWGKKQPPALRTVFRRRDLIAEADPIVGKSTGALEWYSRLSFKELNNISCQIVSHCVVPKSKNAFISSK